MPRIPPQVIEEIVSKTDFVALMGQYLTLRQQGRRLVALCPFHSEKTPSFSIDAERGFFHCFGCHASGDLFKFVMRLENWTFTEAARELGRRVGVEIDDLTPQERADYARKERLRDLMAQAAAHYHELLARSPTAAAARHYLSQRGIGAEVINDFKLGYAPAGPAYLLDWAAARKFTAEDLLACGLATDRTQSGRTVDALRDRVTYPICDPHGQIIAFGGRILGEGQPKYLNSTETVLFSKRTNLYGLYQARHHLRDSEAIVVEGYMDVVALHQAGFRQAVASLGTALTPEQAGLLRRYCASCLLAYDADHAGQAATDKGIEVFEAAGLTARVVTMPDGDDPDSLIKRDGATAFRTRMDKAQSIIDYKMDKLLARLPVHTPEGKSALLKEMMPALGRIRDLVRREAYVVDLVNRASLPEELVRRIAAGLPGSKLPTVAVTTPAKSNWRKKSEEPKNHTATTHNHLPRSTRQPVLANGVPLAGGQTTRPATVAERKAEHDFVRYLMQHPHAISQARERVQAADIDDPLLAAIVSYLYELPSSPRLIGAAELQPLLDREGWREQEGVSKRLSELLLDEKEPLTPQLFEGLLKKIQARRDQAELESLKPLIEKGVQDRSISPDDPLYQKYFQLKQRLMRSK